MTEDIIKNKIARVKGHFPDVEFQYCELNNNAWVIIMRGGFTQENPTDYMDNAVRTLVDQELHNQFIENYLDNPWIRIIIFDFNNIEFK
ncbi:MAG: hypothetical protein IJO27_02330 [Bacilli bacterium]|nr:hypothetical protein [Bacteroidaceae bacterium]MBQ6817248.1 hypothetical protein [Bacilli bacterium]